MTGVAVSSAAARSASTATGGGGRSGFPRPRSISRSPGCARAASTAASMRAKYCSGSRSNRPGAGRMAAKLPCRVPMAELPPALYEPDGDVLVPTALTRGPWDPRHQHAGPPSALLARAIEAAGGIEDGQLARITVDILRPVAL